MINVESEWSVPTNKPSNEKGSSNHRQNKNSNGHHADSSSNRYITAKFNGKVEELLTLGVKEDKHMNSFMVLQK